MAIKCFYCKKSHDTVQQVKDCSKVEIGTIVKETAEVVKVAKITLESVLGADVNPDPKESLKAWAAGQYADETAKFDQMMDDFAKVQVGTIVEEKPAPVAFVPEHRINPNLAKGVVDIFTNVQPDGWGTAAVALPEPVAPKPVLTGQAIELGMYQVDGIVYKVKWNKSKTYKYAEKLVITQTKVWDDSHEDEAEHHYVVVPKGKFAYTAMMTKLTSEHKMDEAAAKAFHDATKEKYGQTYGFCCVCGKLLTDPKSVAAGIGPVCKSKL